MAYSKNRRLAEIVSDTSGNLSVEGIIVPTQSSSDNDTSAASTAFVHAHIDAVLDSAPGTLNTLNEIAAALNDDANFNTTVTNAIAAKLPLAGGTMTGNILIDNSSSASIGLDRGNNTSGSTLDFKTAGTLKWYMGLRGLSNDNFYLRNEAGSTDALTILTNGNVGIGTASPYRQMHIHNSASATVGLMLTNGNTGASNDSQGFQFKVGSDSHAEISQMENSDLRIFTNATEKMRIGSDGAVTLKPNGITTGLRLQGRSSDNNFFVQWKSNDGNTTYGHIGSNAASGRLDYGANTHHFTNQATNNTYMVIDTSGKVGISTTASLSASDYGMLTIKKTSSNIFGDSAITINSADTNQSTLALGLTGSVAYIDSTESGSGTVLPLVFATGSTEKMRITSTGNVGIGVTNPIYGQLQIGDFTDATEALTFATSGNGSSYINFYDANATEGVFIKSTGQTYGGSLIIGAKWDTEETEFTFVALKTGTSSFAINNGGDFTNANGDLNIHATSDDLVLTAEDDVFIQSGNGSSLKTVTLANNGQTSFPGDVLPTTDSAHNLGSTSLRWANLYTGDLHLSNEGSQNDVDGTSGNWTIQEGEEHLFIINNKNGKKFKFALEEVE